MSGQYPRRPGVGKVSKSLLSTKYNIKLVNQQKSSLKSSNEKHVVARATVVHLNFRSQFVLYLALWIGLAGATRLTRIDIMLLIG